MTAESQDWDRRRFQASVWRAVLTTTAITTAWIATSPRLMVPPPRRSSLVLLRKNGELLMKQEDLHAEDPFYERVSG